MKLTKVLLASTLMAFTMTGCIKDNSAIIKVNDGKITKAQYEDVYKKEIQTPHMQQVAELFEDENSLMSLMMRGKIVNELILKEIIAQEVKKREIGVTKEEIQARKADIIEKLGSKEKVDELLKRNGVSNKQFEEDIASEIKVDKLIESTGSTKVSTSDVKDFYNKNKETFNYPERVRASHILVKVNPAEIKQEIISQDKKGLFTSEDINKKTQEVIDAKMALAKEIRQKALNNPDTFASLAKQYSDDKVSAERGGDLGFFTKDAMVKPFSEAAFTLKPGTISNIVVTDYGNHIIVVTDKAQAGIQPFEKVKDEILVYLEQKKKIDVLQELLDGLKASAKIEFVDAKYDLNNIEKMMREKSKEQEKLLKQAQKNKKQK